MTKQKKLTKNIKTTQRHWHNRIEQFFGFFRIQRNFKDRLFICLFQDRDALLELYNALNGSNYDNPDLLEINTLSDAFYIGIKNDCSFIIGNYLNLYEHQSTINPNMPIRGLNYFATIYRTYIQKNHLDIYGSSPVKLPAPQYIIFYNGEKELPDKSELRLSDAFSGNNGCLECIATIININLGHSNDIMNNCKTLFQYAQFVAKVREFHSNGAYHAEAVNRAVEFCIDHDILRDFLTKNRSEVCYMFDTDYSEKKFLAMKEYNFKKILNERDTIIEEMNKTIAGKDNTIAEKDNTIAKKDNTIAEKDKEIAQLKKQLAQKDKL